MKRLREIKEMLGCGWLAAAIVLWVWLRRVR